jgi:hypothetical protein
MARACCLVVIAGGMSLCGEALASRGRICARYRCRALAADLQVNIFQAAARRPSELPYQSTFARWLPTGRLTALGDEINPPSVEITLTQLALTGRFAAFATVLHAGTEAESSVGWSVYRLNVQTGRRDRLDAGGPEDVFLPKAPGVTDVVVTAKGTAAWIAGVNTRPVTYKVFELAAGSKKRVLLANAATIEPKSLSAAPGHLYWTEGGAARVAPAP